MLHYDATHAKPVARYCRNVFVRRDTVSREDPMWRTVEHRVGFLPRARQRHDQTESQSKLIWIRCFGRDKQRHGAAQHQSGTSSHVVHQMQHVGARRFAGAVCVSTLVLHRACPRASIGVPFCSYDEHERPSLPAESSSLDQLGAADAEMVWNGATLLPFGLLLWFLSIQTSMQHPVYRCQQGS